MDSTAPDATVPELIDIWEEGLRSVVAVCAPLSDEQWRAPTPCPGWSVADIVAHVIDIEQLIGGSPRPDHSPNWDTVPHASSDFGRFAEVGVDHRRTHSKADVLAELTDTIAIRREQLDAVPEGQEVIGPLGNATSMERLLRLRSFDTWVHEQDIRTAVSAEGDWDSRPALIAFQQMTRAVPIVWARDVKPTVGSVVQVSVTGPGLSSDVYARVDEAGHGHATDPVDDPIVTLVASWPDFMSLCAGRVDIDDPGLRERITLSGDPDLGRSLLVELAITP